jgi:N-acyl-D-amino-acid deacylase
MHELVIRGGTVIDGTGAKRFTADVAIDGGIVAEVGTIGARGRQEIDANGLLVTPGFVDIHTHYDAQATWDPLLSPSSSNGVTTVVMGNCGVGFAPCKPADRDWIIGLMEGVEEIPGTALHDGIKWEWESFGEYLNALDRKSLAIDVAAFVPHGAVRCYVMGKRAELEAPAEEADIPLMANIVRQALKDGAIGFSTSRTLFNKSIEGILVPGSKADVRELSGLAQAVVDSGHGLIEVVPLGTGGEAPESTMIEMAILRDVARNTGVSIQFLMGQYDANPYAWREQLKAAEEMAREGLKVVPQVFGRGVGMLFSYFATNPFGRLPTYQALRKLSHAERVAALRNPEVRAKILSEEDPINDAWKVLADNPWPKVYPLGDKMDFEPDPTESVEAIARRQGRPAKEVGYDLMLEHDGGAFLSFPLLGYSQRNLDAIREMIMHPLSIIGGSDAGAHAGTVCDAAVPTFMLTHWTRDRTRGDRIELEHIVRKQTMETAKSVGMHDRGVLRPGYKADVNVIDYEKLQLNSPKYLYDLPSGAGRLVQTASGYKHTIVSGKVIASDGIDTGARAGRVVRGGRQITPSRQAA